MDVSTVGIVSTGEMGSSIARTLSRNGLRPITVLEGRSRRTRENARDAGVEDVSPAELAERADVVLSVVVPDAARDVAAMVADAAASAEERPVLVDLNPLAPATVQSVADEFDEHVALVDGCIVGPARDLSRATFYLSGSRAADVPTLDGLQVEVLGDRIGQASGLKLCYAGMTKGLSALGMDLLLAATGLGIAEDAADLYADRLPGVLSFLDGRLPGNPKRAERRAQELDELATMFEDLGVDGELARAGAGRLHWLGSLGLDTDDAGCAVETAQLVYEEIE